MELTLHMYQTSLSIINNHVPFNMSAISFTFLHSITTLSLLSWKPHRIGQFWITMAICRPISVHIWLALVAISQPLMVKWSSKVHNSTFLGYHGNNSQLFWILVYRHTKGYLPWKFQPYSPDGHAASPWVTDFVTEHQAIYKLMELYFCP